MVLCLRKGGVILAWEGMSFLLGYYSAYTGLANPYLRGTIEWSVPFTTDSQRTDLTILN